MSEVLTMRVRITAEHIASGGDDGWTCPLAIALNDHTGTRWHVDRCFAHCEDEHHVLTSSAQRWVEHYDGIHPSERAHLKPCALTVWSSR